MAGEWLKFDASTPDKPEVLAITVAMGWDDPDLTVGKLLRVWRWFDQQTIDGNAVGVTAALLDRLLGVSGLCAAMAKVGWLLITDEGLSLPNFDRHNGKTAKDRALTAKRVANHKANAQGNGKGNGASVSGALPREEKRREEEKKETQAQAPLPDWVPVEAWNGYAEMRKKIRKPMTARAQSLVVKTLERIRERGFSVEEALDNSTRNGWIDVYEPKGASPVATVPKRDSDEYAALHRNASWWRDAGFDSVWSAMSAKCWHNNAHQFRDGKRVEVAA